MNMLPTYEESDFCVQHEGSLLLRGNTFDSEQNGYHFGDVF